MRNRILLALKSTYEDFARNTSLHGVKYTVGKKNNLLGKLLWVCTVLCGMIGAGYMVVLFWKRFTSNPTRTTILTNFAPNSAIPFPAITFCNTNTILDSKLRNFVDKLDLKGYDKETILRIIPQTLAYTSVRDYNVTELDMLQDLLNQNELSNMIDYLKKISQICSEMLIRCKWEGDIVDCRKIFKETFTQDGICCSFGYDLRKKLEIYTDFYGPQMGLSVLLNPTQQNYYYSLYKFDGVRVFVHNSKVYPDRPNTHKILASKRVFFLRISASNIVNSPEVKALTVDHRKCVYNEEHPLQYFYQYFEENCLTECQAKKYLEKCECLPFFYKFEDKDVCNINKIPCLRENVLSEKEVKDCNCLDECEDSVYEVASTSTDYVHDRFLTTNFMTNISEDINVIVLHAFFDSQVQTILTRDMLTSTIYLISSFGGIFSLFLGCSFISAIEVIYFFCIRFFINYKQQNKIEMKNSPKTLKFRIRDKDVFYTRKPFGENTPNTFLN